MIVPDICDPLSFSEIIRGIEVTAANHGYLVLIGDCAHQNQQEKTFIDLIITKQIDGMLLLGSRLPFDASIEEQRNLPPDGDGERILHSNWSYLQFISTI